MDHECAEFGHALVVTYSRPWRRWFRLTHHLRCCCCDLKVSDP